jgi:ATP-dependent RNA helicase DHX8/PRP22
MLSQIPISSCGDDLTALQRALVCGLFMHAAKRQPDGSYKVIASGQTVAIHPSSVLCGQKVIDMRQGTSQVLCLST